LVCIAKVNVENRDLVIQTNTEIDFKNYCSVASDILENDQDGYVKEVDIDYPLVYQGSFMFDKFDAGENPVAGGEFYILFDEGHTLNGSFECDVELIGL
jgi:hypothetical protein